MHHVFTALGSPFGRALVILLAGIGGAYYAHSLLVPSPRPVLVYPLAVPIAGALAALQLRPVRLARSLILGLLGSMLLSWFAFLLLPLPGPSMAIGPGITWYGAVLFSVASALVGSIIGLVYLVIVLCVRRMVGARRPLEVPPRFSLQTLFAVVTVLAVLFGWTAHRLRQFGEERTLANRWSGTGVSITFDYWGRPKGAWTLPDSSLDDESLAELAMLPALQALNISGSKVTDAGIAHLTRHHRLRHLVVAGLPITDAGASQLALMRSLEYIDLFGTKVTPAGVATFAVQHPLVIVRVQPQVIRLVRAAGPKSGAPLNLTDQPSKFRY